MDGATMQYPGVSNKTKDFFFEALTEAGFDINDVKLDASNKAHGRAFGALVDMVATQTPGMGSYFDDFVDRFQTFQATPASEDSAYLDYEEKMHNEFAKIVASLDKALGIAAEEKPFADYVAEAEKQPIANVNIIDNGPLVLDIDAGVRVDAAQPSTPDLPSFMQPNAGKARIHMTPAEAAAHDAAKAKGFSVDAHAVATAKPLSADAPQGHAPLPMAAVPSEAVPEGLAPAIEIPKEGNAPALGGATRDAHSDIDDVEFEEIKKPTLYDLPQNELDTILEQSEAKQDAFVKRALAEWYERYFDAKDLDDATAQIIAEHYTTDRTRADVLNLILDDIAGKKANPNSMSEFDHQVIENHIALDPESVGRALEDRGIDGLSGTDSAKIKSWVFPGLQAAILGAGAGIAARSALDIATGGGVGMIAGAAGGAVGAYASEQYKLNLRAKELLSRKPELEGLSKKELKQHVIKDDKITTLQERLDTVEKKIKDAHDKVAHFRRDFDDHYNGLYADKDGLDKFAKDAEKAQKRIPTLERNRNALIKQLEMTKQRDPASFSLGKHLMSRVMMGAVIGSVAGGVLALEPVQTTLSNAFNAVGGFLASTFDNAMTMSVADLGMLSPDLGVDAAPLAEAAPLVDDSAPLAEPSTQFNAQFGAALSGGEQVAGPADVVPPAEAAPPIVSGPDVVQLDASVLGAVEAFQNSGFEAITHADIAASVEIHFDGDVPARFEPYIDNLASDNPAIRAEAAHSLAHLLVENNAELAKEGHRELASALMAANVVEFGLNSGDPAVGRSIEGLGQYQPALLNAMQAAAASGQDISEIIQLAQQSAAGDIVLTEAVAAAPAQTVRAGHSPNFRSS